MDYKWLVKTEFFCGISEQEIEGMLHCLQTYTRKYKKGEFIYHTGSKIDAMGFVLTGGVYIEQTDVWGNQTIFDNIIPGQVFAETYACVPDELLIIDVIAAKDTEILFLNVERILRTCPSACSFHSRLISNLLLVMAFKNLNLTRKISHITPKSIRNRLSSYLSFQAIKQRKYSFEIPFNRQQLAGYLCVDRSAMSNELSKMQREGLLSVRKNKFELKKTLCENPR